MNRIRSWGKGVVFSLWVCGLCLAACGRRGAAPSRTDHGLVPEPRVTARWVFHPLTKAPSRDRLALGDGQVLEVDDAGGRWLIREGKKPLPSAFGAPESLVGVRKSGAKFWALGEGGSVYFFDEPIGPFSEIRTPPEQFAQSTIAGATLAAVSADGNTYFSADKGRSWKKSKQQEFFVALASVADDQVLAYSVPEQWHLSEDGGRSFSKIGLSTIAPDQLLKEEDGRVFARGIYDSYRYDGEQFTPEPFPQHRAPGYELPRYAAASAVAKGHAVLTDNHFYFLASSGKGAETPFVLYSGQLGTPLTSKNLARPEDCGTYRLAVSDDVLAVLCQNSKTAEVAPRLTLHIARLDAPKLQQRKLLLRGKIGELQIAVRDDAMVALSGVCLPHETEKGCVDRGVLLSEEEQQSFLDLPGIERPDALAFDRLGRIWALAQRDKDDHVLLFGPLSPKEHQTPLVDLSLVAHFPSSEGKHTLALLPGDGDVMSAVTQTHQGFVVASVDREGRLLGRNEAPPKTKLLHGSGRFLAALDHETDAFWTSETGGLSWQRRELPRSICSPEKDRCRPYLFCSSGGCLVGDELTLVGWGPSSQGAPSRLPLSAQTLASDSLARGLRCRAERGWEELPGLMSLPSLGDAALGDAAWVSVQSFPDLAKAVSVSAPFGSSALVKRELLPAVPDASHYAFVVQPQVEGSAVLRYRIPPSVSNASQVETELQVAWENRIEGVLQESTVKETLSYGQLEFSPRQSLSKLANPELLSVAGKGLYLELRSSGLVPAPQYYFRPGGQVERIQPVVWPSTGPRSSGWLRAPSGSYGSHERVQSGTEHGGLLQVHSRSVLVRYWKSERGWTHTPYLMGLLGDVQAEALQSIQIAYRGKHIGFITMQIDPVTRQHRAHFVGMGENEAFEPPIQVPLLSDLPDRAPSCAPSQRESTPRVLSPAPTGPRRNVVVVAALGAPISLSTEGAVLFGSRQTPCVAAFQATSEAGQADQVRYHALVYPGAGQASWLFRLESDVMGGRRVAVRPMTCDYDESSP